MAAIDFSQQEPHILVHYAYVYGSKGLTLDGVEEFVPDIGTIPIWTFTMVAEMADAAKAEKQ